MNLSQARHPRWLFAAAAVVTCTFFINVCNWIHRCGCASLWAGADAHCNIHNAAGPHCPFCSHGPIGYAVVLCLILIPQFVLSRWPRRWPWYFRLTLALLVFPIAAYFASIMMKLIDGDAV